MGEESVRFEVDIGLKDIVCFGYRHYLSLSGSVVFIILAALVMALQVLVWVYSALYRTRVPGYTLFFFIFMAGLAALQAFLIYYQARKSYESGESMKGAQTVTFSASGMDVSGNNRHAGAAWDKVVKAADYHGMLAVTVSPGQAFIIPARYMDPAKRAAAVDMIRKKLDPKKVKIR